MKGDNEYDTLWTSLKEYANSGYYSKHRLLLVLSSSLMLYRWGLGAGRELMGKRKMKHKG